MPSVANGADTRQRDLFQGSQRPLRSRVQEMHWRPFERMQTLHCSGERVPEPSARRDGDCYVTTH